MIVEERRIAFSREAVMAAVGLFAKPCAVALPPGHIVGVEAEDSGCQLEVAPVGSDKLERLTIESSAVASMLILYASRQGIPIPKRGDKTLERAADGFALNIRLESHG
jgi:hypothetical protein